MHSRHHLSIALAVFVGWAGSVSTLHSAEYRVGEGGDYATLREAVAIAAATPGEHKIKVRAGHYREGSYHSVRLSAEVDLEILGGWDATFASRTLDPAATVFDGDAVGPVVAFGVAGGSLILEGLAFRNGTSGLAVTVSKSGFLRISRCVADANIAESPEFSIIGIGATVIADDSRVEIVDSVFSNNLAITPLNVTQGAGLSMQLTGSQASILRNRFVANKSTAQWTEGAGLELEIDGSGSRAEVADNEFSGNVAQSTEPEDTIFDSSALAVQDIGEGSRVELRRNRFEANLGAPQLIVGNRAGSHLLVSDSLFARGSSGSVAIECRWCEGDNQLTNLTIADSGGIRIGPHPAATVAISNTIIFGPGAEIVTDPGIPAPALSANLVAVDPLFVNAAAGDYRLLPGSPGIDAGDDLPPGDLGPSDLAGNPRRTGARVDIGAYELSLGALGRSGACLVGSRVFPVPAHTNACTCIRDEGLRNHRCGFFLPEIFLDAVIPIPLDPNDPTDPQWVILPWQGADGAYDLFFEVLRNGKWTAVAGSGPPTGTLKLHELTVEKFMLPGGERDLPLRARLQHFAPGPQGPVTVEDVVYLFVGK